MKQITRAALKKFTADAEKALEAVAKKHGVQVSYKSARFTSANATMKFEIATIGKDGTAKTQEATDFERYAEQLGFNPSDLGSTFSWQGKTYMIVGLKPRSRKAPVVVESTIDGKRFKMPVDMVKPQKVTGLTKELKEKFLDLACRLEPENLSCDGELPMAQVRKRRTSILREWGSLERRAGRTVTDTEAWSFHEGLKVDLPKSEKGLVS